MNVKRNPLTYMMDTLLKDGMEFFSKENTRSNYLEKDYEKLLQGLDLSIDKLYSFSLSAISAQETSAGTSSG